MSKKIIIGITGASGAIYAKKLIDDILLLSDYHISVIYSDNGKKVWLHELGIPTLTGSDRIKIYENNDMFASPASGSSMYDAMVVVPCSMGTLSQISHGASNNLIGRSADVMLKERRTLIVVPRELPLNLMHVQNMEKILLAGGIVMPASPSFYHKPQTLDDLVKTVTDRILRILGVSIEIKEWGK